MNSCVNLPFGLSEAEKKTFKRQYWSIIIYEESVKKDYLQILGELQYKMALSPWHDLDYNEDGTQKKKHRHLLIDFGGSVRTKQVCDVANSINAHNDVKWCGNKKISFEYLTHRNNPEKAQYNPADIILINSKIYDWLQTAYKDILNYIDDNKILSFSKLTKVLRKDEQDYLLEYVSHNAYYVSLYLKDIKDDTIIKIEQLYKDVYRLIRDYEIDKIIKSESIKAITSKMEELNLNFDIMED